VRSPVDLSTTALGGCSRLQLLGGYTEPWVVPSTIDAKYERPYLMSQQLVGVPTCPYRCCLGT
jgi:hypothetical protein